MEDHLSTDNRWRSSDCGRVAERACSGSTVLRLQSSSSASNNAANKHIAASCIMQPSRTAMQPSSSHQARRCRPSMRAGCMSSLCYKVRMCACTLKEASELQPPPWAAERKTRRQTIEQAQLLVQIGKMAGTPTWKGLGCKRLEWSHVCPPGVQGAEMQGAGNAHMAGEQGGHVYPAIYWQPAED
eukprot:1161212-Pelagomonas_calceolata.AAC.19